MALASMENLLAALPDYSALGSFTVGNMEMVIGAVKAAEETGTPILIQIAEARLKQSPLAIFGPLMLAAARTARIDIGVHLDHGATESVITDAVRHGFSSIMFDGSHLPYRENAETTADMRTKALAINPGASVEGELGVVGGSEDDLAARTVHCTDPGQVADFCEQTGIDALAVAIGNAHGNYKETPALRFDVLRRIAGATSVPLVLHGGSGLSDDDFRKAIRCGIKKVNIATAVFFEVGKQIHSSLQPGNFHDYRRLNETMVQAAYESVKKHILLFNHGDRHEASKE